jgi:hypothetical protein
LFEFAAAGQGQSSLCHCKEVLRLSWIVGSGS